MEFSCIKASKSIYAKVDSFRGSKWRTIKLSKQKTIYIRYNSINSWKTVSNKASIMYMLVRNYLVANTLFYTMAWPMSNLDNIWSLPKIPEKLCRAITGIQAFSLTLILTQKLAISNSFKILEEIYKKWFTIMDFFYIRPFSKLFQRANEL